MVSSEGECRREKGKYTVGRVEDKMVKWRVNTTLTTLQRHRMQLARIGAR